MRIAICDNNSVDRQILKSLLETMASDYTVTEFDGGAELIKEHERKPFSLIFIEGVLPEASGIETAKRIRAFDEGIPIIFLSESDSFAAQSYRVNAFDYIVKPIDKDILYECLKRLFMLGQNKQFLTINYLGVDVKILLHNIVCMESNLRKTVFYLTDNREITVIAKLSDYEQHLLSHGFLRCHKSYLVNIEHVKNIEGNVFYMSNQKAVKITRTYFNEAKKTYFDYIFGR